VLATKPTLLKKPIRQLKWFFFFLHPLFFLWLKNIACYGQLQPDNYNRRSNGPSRPQQVQPPQQQQLNEPPVQERSYLDDYDYDQQQQTAQNKNFNEEEDDDNLYEGAGGRTANRPVNTKNAPIRQGPPLQGLLSFGDTSADCKPKYRTLPHEKYCDVYFEQSGCDGQTEKSQAILRACPNGLVYTGNGRNGLIGVCDYPHRAECAGKERHSKLTTFSLS
jgi:hypothetical protein